MLLAATVLLVVVVLATTDREGEVRFDEVGAVNLVEVVGGEPDLVAAAVAAAGGEIVEVLEPGATLTTVVTRARFAEVRDRDHQRAVIDRLETDGLTARPAMILRRD